MSDSLNVFEEFLAGHRPLSSRVPREDAEEHAPILQWSITLRNGRPADRAAAMRGLCSRLRPSLSLTTVVRWFGDPWHRAAPRACPLTGIRREVLAWRHPEDERAQLQMLFCEGRFARGQVVVDKGASLPPRIHALEDYWPGVDADEALAAQAGS